MKISISQENYLKTIFHLQPTQGTVSTNDLAAALHTRPASVTDMLKKLKLQKLISYQKYQGFKLSREGRRQAILIVRKHRLWELFLVEKLHFRWDEVHEVAEELEHISSHQLIDRLDQFLGFPQADPHGDPIPDKDGHIPPADSRSLLQAPVHRIQVVTGITQHTPQIRELLEHRQIRLGTRLEVKRKFPFDQSLEVKIANRPATMLSELLARHILVKNETGSR